MSEGIDSCESDWAMWRDFATMRRHLDRAIEQRLQRDAAISTPEFEVLRSLSAAEGHRLRAGALAEALGWEKSRISHQVSRMAGRGFLERTSCPTDARGTWVAMSPAGADALATASCGYTETLETFLFTVVDDDGKRSLHNAARQVIAALADQPTATVDPIEQPAALR